MTGRLTSEGRMKTRGRLGSVAAATALALLVSVAPASASTPGVDRRLTHDANDPGYVTSYFVATGDARFESQDPTISECSRSRGRQNEPSVAIDPRNTNVILGSSNDYCGVYNDGADADGAPIPSGPIWLGYYRSENAGGSFVTSLVPGYPGDATPYASRAHVRTASAGDPVIAWDTHGNAYFGAESSDDPSGSAKTFGDVWVGRYRNPKAPSDVGFTTLDDGKEFAYSNIVARGSSAPFLLGKFNDKTAIEVDRSGACPGGRGTGNVYFAWSRFVGGAGGSSIYFTRSTDQARTWSKPMNLTPKGRDVQFADIAVTGDGTVYVAWVSGNSIAYARSTDCGRSFSRQRTVLSFIPNSASDSSDPQARRTARDEDGFETESGRDAGDARDCGSLYDHCASGYTFFRRDTQVRASADQAANDQFVYLVYDASIPDTVTAANSTYSTVPGDRVAQAGVYFVRLNGATGAHGTPRLIDPSDRRDHRGHQIFPDINVDHGQMHAIWWDSRNDPAYSVQRPIGNDANGRVYPSLDAFGARAAAGANPSWTIARVSDVTSAPNFEQFDARAVPFAGDYLWVSSVGSFSYGAWTDWRNTRGAVPGHDDLREAQAPDEDDAGTPQFAGSVPADVYQCRHYLADGSVSGDTCPREGGLDQNIYGDLSP
jgi:hypothetical protein